MRLNDCGPGVCVSNHVCARRMRGAIFNHQLPGKSASLAHRLGSTRISLGQDYWKGPAHLKTSKVTKRSTLLLDVCFAHADLASRDLRCARTISCIRLTEAIAIFESHWCWSSSPAALPSDHSQYCGPLRLQLRYAKYSICGCPALHS